MKKLSILAVALISITLSLPSCTKDKGADKKGKEVQAYKQTPKPVESGSTESSNSAVTHITSDAQFQEVLKRSDSVLVIFDLYADWCGPCKKLSPRLAEIATEVVGKAEVYKINVDKLPNIAQAFGVKSIPLVVFMKEQKGVNGILGLREKAVYLDAIEKFAFKK